MSEVPLVVGEGQGGSRWEKVLRREVLACEDPICCCEAEPRWIVRGLEGEGEQLSEWEVLGRTPRDEL